MLRSSPARSFGEDQDPELEWMASAQPQGTVPGLPTPFPPSGSSHSPEFPSWCFAFQCSSFPSQCPKPRAAPPGNLDHPKTSGFLLTGAVMCCEHHVQVFCICTDLCHTVHSWAWAYGFLIAPM